MFEKVSPLHPDKIADRIAGAIVDYAYTLENDPKIAVEVLIGHNDCTVQIESNVDKKLDITELSKIIIDITQNEELGIHYIINPQDEHLADNQKKEMRCGDNGIFLGRPKTSEESLLTKLVQKRYTRDKSDAKYIYDENRDYIVACEGGHPKYEFQPSHNYESFSNDASLTMLQKLRIIYNPLGNWTGGINVDTGATNRKLGSDMGRSVTGGGLHGKDLSKADVSVNIFCFLWANRLRKDVTASCAIGDKTVEVNFGDGDYQYIPFKEIVEVARNYIKEIGGFEKFAEYGLIR